MTELTEGDIYFAVYFTIGSKRTFYIGRMINQIAETVKLIFLEVWQRNEIKVQLVKKG